MQQMRLRVAIFSNAYKPTISGVVTSVCLFRKGLLEKGHDVHLFTPKVEGYEDDEPYVYRLPALLDLTKAYELSLALPIKWPMRHTLKGIKPHLIHSQHPVLVGDLAMRYAQDLKLPLVFTFHTRYQEFIQSYAPIFAEWFGQVAREVVHDYMERCTHVIVPTPSVQDMIHRDYQVDVPVTVLPTPIDVEQFARSDPAPVRERYHLEGKEVLMYLGRISPEKDIDFLLRVFARVAAQRPQTMLFIVGRGPNAEELKELAQSFHLQERVVFTGAVPYKDVPQYLSAATLFTFPSRSETQGLVLLEAMAAGTPVVAVQATSSEDVLRDCKGGILVRRDEAAFADDILSTLADPEQLARMRQAAQKTTQGYSVAAATERLLEVYDQALTRGPSTLSRWQQLASRSPLLKQ